MERKARRYGRFSEVNNFCAERGSISLSKEQWARKMLADAAQEKQEGIQGQRQQASLFKEVFEQVKRNADTDCNAQIVRRAYNAKQSGNLESFIQRGIRERRKAL